MKANRSCNINGFYFRICQKRLIIIVSLFCTVLFTQDVYKRQLMDGKTATTALPTISTATAKTIPLTN